MRADRLLSLLLLLRRRGRLTAGQLAVELEVSVRTVLRDVEALSTAGVPVYAERGRTGGIVLLPGWTTDLTGLTDGEATALVTAGSRATSRALGMAPELAAAMRKLVAGMPEAQRVVAEHAVQRVLVVPDRWLARPEPDGQLAAVQQAVFTDRRLRIRYAGRESALSDRTIDPLGLVHAGGHWYLLATHRGADRTYRVARIRAATVLAEPCTRPPDLDLAALWRQRTGDFAAAMPGVEVDLRVREHRADDVRSSARAVPADEPDGPGWRRMTARFGDDRHALGVLWSAGPDVEVLAPAALRAAVAARAAEITRRYA